jgi:hypothetical protein
LFASFTLLLFIDSHFSAGGQLITDADLYVLKEQALLDYSDLPSAERPAHACTGPSTCSICAAQLNSGEKQTTLDHLKVVLGGAGGIEIGAGSPNGAASHDSGRPTTAGANRAVSNDQPVQSVTATLPDHHITLYTNVKNDSRWSAYVSYRPT